mmetsp:Transcript_45057/g.141254  ORF Transcript_45057/g.141254 Transcript_45057/m.141254 type:complete len:201 (-) Transcript_45057:921-1523(-)
MVGLSSRRCFNRIQPRRRHPRRRNSRYQHPGRRSSSRSSSSSGHIHLRASGWSRLSRARSFRPPAMRRTPWRWTTPGWPRRSRCRGPAAMPSAGRCAPASPWRSSARRSRGAATAPSSRARHRPPLPPRPACTSRAPSRCPRSGRTIRAARPWRRLPSLRPPAAPTPRTGRPGRGSCSTSPASRRCGSSASSTWASSSPP